jgi:hypothetical protein
MYASFIASSARSSSDRSSTRCTDVSLAVSGPWDPREVREPLREDAREALAGACLSSPSSPAWASALLAAGPTGSLDCPTAATTPAHASTTPPILSMYRWVASRHMRPRSVTWRLKETPSPGGRAPRTVASPGREAGSPEGANGATEYSASILAAELREVRRAAPGTAGALGAF